jgi:hypothetical protein
MRPTPGGESGTFNGALTWVDDGCLPLANALPAAALVSLPSCYCAADSAAAISASVMRKFKPEYGRMSMNERRLTRSDWN